MANMIKLDIQENLCEDCNCDWYDGSSCCHPKFEQFPFKLRKKTCKHYVVHDNREDDLEDMAQDQWEQEHYFDGENWDE